MKDDAKIVIIGAGVAGLQTLRSLKAHGFRNLRCFEAASDIGRVWRENYAGYGVQAPRATFEFPDFPFSQVQRVSQWRAGQGLYQKFRISIFSNTSTSTQVSKRPNPKVRKLQIDDETIECDHLVIAMYSRPQFPKEKDEANHPRVGVPR